MPASKNKKTLDSFVKYCTEHPELRFWQALRNWSGYAFIFGGNLVMSTPEGLHESHPFTTDQLIVLAESLGLEDTFYKK